MPGTTQFSKKQLVIAIGTILSASLAPGIQAACTVDGQTYTVNNALDPAINTVPTVITLRDAIENANADPNCDTINFASSLNGQTITLDPVTNGPIFITESVNIVGPGSDQLTLTQPEASAASQYTDSLLNMHAGDIDISGITFDGLGTSDDAGLAAVENISTMSGYRDINLTIDDIVVQNITTGTYGDSGLYTGGIESLTVTNSRFDGNGSEGIYASAAQVTLSNITSVNNEGAGVRISSATSAVLEDSTISGNTGNYGAGGVDISIYSSGSSVIIDNTTIDNNQADNTGAGGIDIYASSGASVTIRNSTISNNSSNGPYNPANLLQGSGGGIAVDGAEYSLLIEQSTISGNSAASAGGAIYFDDRNVANTININFSTLTDNTADYGGGIFSTDTGADVNISNTIVAANTANVQDDDIGVSEPSVTAGDVIADFSFIGISGVNVSDAGVGSSLNGGDPMLAALADGIGSATTLTHAPLATSPVIDMGDPVLLAGTGNTPTSDQDGRPRVSNSRIDIGAIESTSNQPPQLDTAITAATATVGEAFSINLDDHFSDPDGDNITYSILNSADVPGNISVTGSNASGTFVEGDIGTYTVNYQACDPEPLCVTGSGDLTVVAEDSDSSGGGGLFGHGLLVLLGSLLGFRRYFRKS